MLQHEEHLHFEGSGRTKLAINIAPLIDVVFLLLIFFMLTTSFLEEEAIVLQLPSASTKALPATDRIVVTIDADGSIKLNDESLPLDSLGDRINTLLREDTYGQSIAILAERSVPVQWTIDVMDKIRAGGSDKIKFLTRPR